ncbi:hypothetical protein ILUMI_03412 [Ignelater luminosus]|uniref:Uncharacterized protein n=1 Tax=Ignelater luminosus TaxID=2038154 RepID=A0A8K0DGK9_IGNLU|nr:hypothetical protein ILUMI_03412 [Ignelater luminosus]
MFHLLNHCKNVEELTITYLVAGHTYMPVDSVHAVIENYSKSMNVQAPSEWSTIIRNARRRPKPYEIIQVYYPDILDWKSLSVTRKLQSVDVEWTNKRYENVPQAYNGELPINTKKLKNLLDLCKTLTIKKQYHGEYYALRTSNNVPDVLPETDIEDNV